MMLRPAVAGFTYAKLAPLLGWPGGLHGAVWRIKQLRPQAECRG